MTTSAAEDPQKPDPGAVRRAVVERAAAQLTHDRVHLTPAARRALVALGDELRRAGPDGWSRPMAAGAPAARSTFDEQVGPDAAEALIAAGLATAVGTDLLLAVTIVEIGGVLTVIPKVAWGDEVVYLGPDSAHLAEAVLRLVPHGERAVDLGTGTGLLAALLARRFRHVVATDLALSVAVAAELTLALNRFPPGRRQVVCLADVAAGLRPRSFDLVAGNAPWVPLAAESRAPRDLFSHGGDLGSELPLRFIRDGAQCLRPGGVAITLALDVTVRADDASAAQHQPLAAVCDELEDDGFVTRRIATPFNRERQGLADLMRSRQPKLEDATHVAVIVARPRHDGDGRGSLQVAIDALERRWAATRPG